MNRSMPRTWLILGAVVGALVATAPASAQTDGKSATVKQDYPDSLLWSPGDMNQQMAMSQLDKTKPEVPAKVRKEVVDILRDWDQLPRSLTQSEVEEKGGGKTAPKQPS